MIRIETATVTKRKLRPFDAAKMDDFAMYNRLPYFRDIDLCTPETITLVTGNVIKYFQYTINDTFTLSGIDQLAMVKIAEYQERNKEPDVSEEESDATAFVDSEAELSVTSESAESDTTTTDSATQEASSRPHPAYLDLDFE